MPKFRIGRLEVHVYPVEIEADDMVDAMAKVLNGEGDSVDIEGDTYVETDDERGITIDELIDLYPDLDVKRLGDLVNGDDFVPSIRSVEEV